MFNIETNTNHGEILFELISNTEHYLTGNKKDGKM